MSSDGEVSEELPAEENSHLRRPITGHCLVKLLLRESLKCSPVLPARKNLDFAFLLATNNYHKPGLFFHKMMMLIE